MEFNLLRMDWSKLSMSCQSKVLSEQNISQQSYECSSVVPVQSEGNVQSVCVPLVRAEGRSESEVYSCSGLVCCFVSLPSFILNHWNGICVSVQ